MKRILQIFSVLLLSCTAVVLFGVVKQDKALADNTNLCRWINGSQIRCVHPSDNALNNKVQALLSNAADKQALIRRIASGDHTIDTVIADGEKDLDNPLNCGVDPLSAKASCDDLYYNPTGSDRDTVVFENNSIKGYFQNVKIICKTYTIGEPQADKPDSNLYAGNFCDAQGYAGSTASGMVLVGDIQNATAQSGNNCGIGKTTNCTLAGPVDGRSAGSAITSNANLDVFKTGITNTIKLKNDTIAGASDCVPSSLSFFLCPLSNILDELIKGALNTIEKLLILPPLLPGTGIETAVKGLTNVANAAYGLIFLIIIFANFIAIPGLDNYTIKKLLPKLIFVIIITQFAFLICSVLVDLGNILGNTIPSAITTAYNGKSAEQMITELFNPIKQLNTGVADLSSNPITGLTNIFTGLGKWAMLFIVEIAAVVIAFIGMFYLIFRFAAVGILTIISPIAFAAWVLPNTEAFTKWWFKNYLKLVLMYVMVMIVLVSTAVLSSAFISAANGGSIISGVIAVFLPLFALILIPKILKFSGSTITAVGKLASESRGGKLASGSAKSAAKKSAQEGKLAEYKGSAYSKFGKALPGTKLGLGLEARGEQLKKAKINAEKDRLSKLSIPRQLREASGGNKTAKAALNEKLSELSNKRSLTAQEYANLKVLKENAGQDTSHYTENIPTDADGKALVNGVFNNPDYVDSGTSRFANADETTLQQTIHTADEANATFNDPNHPNSTAATPAQTAAASEAKAEANKRYREKAVIYKSAHDAGIQPPAAGTKEHIEFNRLAHIVAGKSDQYDPAAGHPDYLSNLASTWAPPPTPPPPGACWVAREIYGVNNPKWLVFREWMLLESPTWFRFTYLKYGEDFAKWVKPHKLTKSIIRIFMDNRIRNR